MKGDAFVTADGVGGHLEYIGQPLNVDGSVHCWRREVRETLAGFEVHDVRFMKFRGYWREAYRDKNDVYKSKAEAIQAVKQHEKGWWEAVADDLEEQRDRERIEAGHELAREAHRGPPKRDIVDMGYDDDGLTPKEALEIEKLRPIGFLGKDILAIQKEAKPVTDDSKAYREQLAHEFRQAIEALPPMPDKTCDWCGVELQTMNDHKIVDAQRMCLECVKQYSLEESSGYER
jgi:hypothetical protein